MVDELYEPQSDGRGERFAWVTAPTLASLFRGTTNLSMVRVFPINIKSLNPLKYQAEALDFT